MNSKHLQRDFLIERWYGMKWYASFRYSILYSNQLRVFIFFFLFLLYFFFFLFFSFHFLHCCYEIEAEKLLLCAHRIEFDALYVLGMFRLAKVTIHEQCCVPSLFCCLLLPLLLVAVLHIQLYLQTAIDIR